MAVSLDVSDGIALIRIGEPSDTVLSDTVLSDMRALLPVPADARSVVLVVGRGSGGGDVKRLVRTPAAQREAASASLRRLCDEVADLPVPVIAAITGTAFGAATALAMACDLRVLTADGALGWVTGDRALVARRVNSDEALRTGLVDHVVPSSAVLPTALELANECKPMQVERNSCRIVAS